MVDGLRPAVAVELVALGPGELRLRAHLKQGLLRKQRIWIEFQHNTLLVCHGLTAVPSGRRASIQSQATLLSLQGYFAASSSLISTPMPGFSFR